MSRIGKSPINIPSWVTIEINNLIVKVKGPKWELSQDIKDFVTVDIKDNIANVQISNMEDSFQRWVWGLTRTLINNMVVGVTTGYSKQLEIVWVWYKFEVVWTNKLILSAGFSHKVELVAPAWLTIATDPNLKNTISISWIDKQLVGFFAAKVRQVKKPEPYKGKWIKYVWEYVRRKAGKTWGKK